MIDSRYIDLDEVSQYWKRFAAQTVQSQLKASEHAVLLRGLAQQEFALDPRGIASGLWEDGPQDF